jgi:hypothetical protein
MLHCRFGSGKVQHFCPYPDPIRHRNKRSTRLDTEKKIFPYPLGPVLTLIFGLLSSTGSWSCLNRTGLNRKYLSWGNAVTNCQAKTFLIGYVA